MTTKVHNRMLEGAPVSVLDFGADPTGTSDSTAAIQNALNAGSVVTFPKGTYLCGPVTRTVPDLTIHGNFSKILSVLEPDNSSNGIFNITGGGRVTIRDLVIDGQAGTDTSISGSETATGDPIYINNSFSVTLDNINITGWKSGSGFVYADASAVYCLDCGEVTISNCDISYISREGVISVNGKRVRYINNSFNNVGYSPMALTDIPDGLVTGNKTTTTGVNAPSVSLLPLIRCNNITISNNYMFEHGQSFTTEYDSVYGAPAIVLHNDATNTPIANIEISNNTISKVRTALFDQTTLSQKENISFNGNNVSRFFEGVQGLYLTSGVSISNNTFSLGRRAIMQTTQSLSNVSIIGNIIRNMQQGGIRIIGDTTDTVVLNANISNNNVSDTEAQYSYYLQDIGGSVIDGNIAISGGETPTGHFYITNTLVRILVSNNSASGSVSSAKYFFSGASSNERVLRFNYGHAVNDLGGTNGSMWDENSEEGALIQLANQRVWTDASGNLRIKFGAPASDTDGVVVGTQT